MHLVQSYTLPTSLNKAVSFGGAGVHVFILCSGFGLYLSYLHKPLSYRNFLKRRFTKVYFPYIFIILLSALWVFFKSGIFDWAAVLSHIFLFKMFFPEYESSFGGQMWFVSTIIQFYIAWPLMVKLVKTKWCLLWGLSISLGWATLVGLLGYDEERVWNSFFLQYVWEFVLGMWLAAYYQKSPDSQIIPNWLFVIAGAIIGIALTGVMAWNGGVLKLYNDIPSLIGFISILLFIYKLSIPFVNRIICYTNQISYEWYLVHILIFDITKYYINGSTSVVTELAICLLASYTCAFLYDFMLRRVHAK